MQVTRVALYEAFPPAEARRLVERFEWHYTPKHGSWLDMAESELGVLSSQCLDRRIPDQQVLGKLLSPARRRACIEHVQGVLSISERRACATLGQHRSTQRKNPRGRDDEERLTADMVTLAKQYGRYGYRKIAEFLRRPCSSWCQDQP